MINLKKMLEEDPKYKQILESLSIEEREGLKKYMEHFMHAWQTGVFDPILSNSQNAEFASALEKEMKDKNFGK